MGSDKPRGAARRAYEMRARMGRTNRRQVSRRRDAQQARAAVRAVTFHGGELPARGHAAAVPRQRGGFRRGRRRIFPTPQAAVFRMLVANLHTFTGLRCT